MHACFLYVSQKIYTHVVVVFQVSLYYICEANTKGGRHIPSCMSGQGANFRKHDAAVRRLVQMYKEAHPVERANDRLEVIDADKNQIPVCAPFYTAGGDKENNLAVFPDITISRGRKLPMTLFDKETKEFGHFRTTGFTMSNTTDRALAVARHANQHGVALQHYDVMVTSEEGLAKIRAATKGKASKYKRTFARLQVEAGAPTTDVRVADIGRIYATAPSVIPLIVTLDGSCGPNIEKLAYQCACNLYPATGNSFSYHAQRSQFMARHLKKIQTAVMEECAPIVRHAGDLLRAASMQDLVELERHDSLSVVTGEDDVVGGAGGPMVRNVSDIVEPTARDDGLGVQLVAVGTSRSVSRELSESEEGY